MADDLMEVSEDSLKAMTELEGQAEELHGHVVNLLAQSRQHNDQLSEDESKFDLRFDEFSKHLGDLHEKLAQAGERVNSRLGAHLEELDRQKKERDDHHRVLRQHLKDLRDAIMGVTTDLDVLERASHKALLQIKQESVTLLAGTVSALDSAELSLRTVTTPKVTGVTGSVSARAKKLHNHVENVLIPRINADATRVGERLTAVSNRLAGALSQAQKLTLLQAQTHVATFQQVSGTDWRGSSGPVDAKGRVGELDRLGADQSAAISANTRALAGLATNLKNVVDSAKYQYNQVFTVPTQIKTVVDKV